MMNSPLALSVGWIAAVAASSQLGALVAQDVSRASATEWGPPTTSPAPEGFGDVVAGPFDIETLAGPAPGDNRCLGVEAMANGFFITGRGHTTIGDNPMIHRFDLDGNYVASYPQVTLSTGWAGRDMESHGGRLFVGSDQGEVSEYLWDCGVLVHSALYTTSVPQTIHGLCRNPHTGYFHTKSFLNDFYTFELPSGAILSSTIDDNYSAYGLAWDPRVDRIWASTTGAALTLATENGVHMGGGFTPSLGGTQGGVDTYLDPRNPGGYSVVALHQATPDQIVVYDAFGGPCKPFPYCFPKVNSQGCTPMISIPPTCVPAGGSLLLSSTGLLNQKAGVFFFGTGPTECPFQDGTLCIAPPFSKSPVLGSGGTIGPTDCSGVLSFDVGPLGNPGATLYFQAWSIDPWAGSGTSLSDAVALTYL